MPAVMQTTTTATTGSTTAPTSAKINFSYSILFYLTTSYSSYFGGKKGINRNKTSFFLLMLPLHNESPQQLTKLYEGTQEVNLENLENLEGLEDLEP